MSKRGLCAQHSEELTVKGPREMHEHRGETFLAWRRGMAATVGGVLVDDIRQAIEDTA